MNWKKQNRFGDNHSEEVLMYSVERLFLHGHPVLTLLLDMCHSKVFDAALRASTGERLRFGRVREFWPVNVCL